MFRSDIQSLVADEVDSIVGLADCLDGEEFAGWPDGMEEMPAAIKWELGMIGIEAVTAWEFMAADGRAVDLAHKTDALKEIACLAFLMGRHFGKLEAATGLKNIAANVPMAETNHPTAEYEMAKDYRGPIT